MVKHSRELKKRRFFRYSAISLVFLALLLFSFRFDPEIVAYVAGLQNIWLNNILLGVTFLSSSVVVLFFLTSLFLWHEHKRKWILPLWLSLAFSGIFSIILKSIAARARPFAVGIVKDMLPIFSSTLASWNSSFPSLHATVVFSALPVLGKKFTYFKFAWLFFACSVAFSRIYFGLHYLSDVLVGAFLGYLTGLVFVKLEEKYEYGKLIEFVWRRFQKND